MKGMFEVSVTGSMRPIIRDLERVSQHHIPAATVSALNKTAKHIETEVERELAAKLAAPKKLVTKKVSVGKASRRRLDAVIFGKHRPVNPGEISKASAKRRAKLIGGFVVDAGTGARLVASQGRTYKGRSTVRWSAITKSGRVHRYTTLRGRRIISVPMVFKRKGKARLPLWGPGDEKAPDPSPGLKLYPELDAIIRRRIKANQEDFARTFEHELQFRIDREKGSV